MPTVTRKRKLEDRSSASDSLSRSPPQSIDSCPRCSIDGCNNNAVEGGACIKHVGKGVGNMKDGCNIERCSSNGCRNNATARGENCQEHGGKRIRAPRKRCSQRGCKKRESIKLGNGLCLSCDPQHTDARQKCSIDGCDNTAASAGGTCRTHGGKRIYKCGHDGCEKWAAVGGYCHRHRSPSKRVSTCYVDGCSQNLVEGSGLCTKHKCSHEGCTRQSTTEGGTCVKHGGKKKSYLKKCSHEGCDNSSQKGGVCRSHDPTRKRKREIAPVTNETSSEKNDRPEKGGLCWSHNRGGPKVISDKPKCSMDGCKNIAAKEGKCHYHGGNYIRDTRQQCSHSGCKKKESKQLKTGLCLLHGMETCKPTGGELPISLKVNPRCSDRPRCSNDGCGRQADAGGKCLNHGGKRIYKTCSHEDCTSRAVKGGLCCFHNHPKPKVINNKPKCSMDGCKNIAAKEGKCHYHGGNYIRDTRQQCSHSGCKKKESKQLKTGLCLLHGGKLPISLQVKPNRCSDRPRCSNDGCGRQAESGGKCRNHGGKRIHNTSV